MHRIALAIEKGSGAGKAPLRDPSGEKAPRDYLFDEAFSPAWDESIVGTGPSGGTRGRWRMAGEILRRQTEYDAVITWGEKLTFALLMQQRIARISKPHVALMYQFEKPNIRVPMALLKKSLHAVVTWSSVQRRVLIDEIGFPAERVYLIRHYVDQVFYSPREAGGEMISAVGAEMRDYATLKEALRGTGIRCHIAADHVRIPGRFRLLNDRRVPIEDIGGPADGGITQGRMTLLELRDLYARSRFVVIPLLSSDTDNGVTCILQAMAMRKPVICTRTRGQVDVIEDGVTGLYVPIGDAAALRAAIFSLWNDPERARQMGRNARAYIEKYHTLEMFTSTVRSAAEASVEGRAAPEAWWEERSVLA
ncbi:MAG: glycosyltransferase family 4 protein [Pseudomonadota bacterium]